jgi:hypothetical protein
MVVINMFSGMIAIQDVAESETSSRIIGQTFRVYEPGWVGSKARWAEGIP